MLHAALGARLLRASRQAGSSLRVYSGGISVYFRAGFIPFRAYTILTPK